MPSVAEDLGGGLHGYRVLRGGSWFLNSRFTRSAFRLRLGAGYRYIFNGFRLVRELD
jgi:formylglycine-generating enzyme required for sulfatase activity